MVGKEFEIAKSWRCETLLVTNQTDPIFALSVGIINGESTGLGKRRKRTKKRSQAKNNRALACVQCRPPVRKRSSVYGHSRKKANNLSINPLYSIDLIAVFRQSQSGNYVLER